MWKNVHKYLNLRYVAKIGLIYGVQIVVLAALFEGDLSMSIGGKSLYYFNPVFFVLYSSPVLLSIYCLIQEWSREFNISKIYMLTRYKHVGQWGSYMVRKGFLSNLLAFTLISLFAFVVSLSLGSSSAFPGSLLSLGLYLVNSTLIFSVLLMAVLTLSLRADSDTMQVLLLCVCAGSLFLAPLLYTNHKHALWVLLFPINHIAIWERPSEFLFSFLWGITLYIFVRLRFSFLVKGIDLLD